MDYYFFSPDRHFGHLHFHLTGYFVLLKSVNQLAKLDWPNRYTGTSYTTVRNANMVIWPYISRTNYSMVMS